MNDQTDSTQKSTPGSTPTGPGSSASPGSLSAGASTGSDSVAGTGMGNSPSMGARMGSTSGTDLGGSGSGSGSGAGVTQSRSDYSSSAGDEPSFDGTAASLESLPIGEAMHEMVETARQLVREHPLAAVAAGVLVGMVLGRR